MSRRGSRPGGTPNRPQLQLPTNLRPHNNSVTRQLPAYLQWLSNYDPRLPKTTQDIVTFQHLNTLMAEAENISEEVILIGPYTDDDTGRAFHRMANLMAVGIRIFSIRQGRAALNYVGS